MNDPRRPRLLSRESAPNECWYRVFAKQGKTATIELYDEIGIWGTSAKDFVAEVRDLKAEQIDLHVNSPGGDAWDGIAIYNALRDHKAKVVVTVDGIAASAASLVVMAGDEIIMNRHSEMMIHEAWGMCIGNASDMTDMVTRLDKISANIAAVYAERAGGDVEDWRQAMRDETWYSADEAVEAGLADKVAASARDAEKEKNRFDLSIFNHAGRRLAPTPRLKTNQSDSTVAMSDAGTVHATTQEDQLTPEQLQKLGLPEDATQEQIDEKLDEYQRLAEAQTNEGAEGEGEDAEGESTTPADDAEDAGETAGSEGGAAAGQVEQPQASARKSQPAGEDVVKVDKAAWASVQSRLAQVDALLEEKRLAARESVIEAAISDGKIPPARRAHWEKSYDADAEGTTAVLASMEKGLIPVAERGHGGDNEIQASASQDDAYPALWGRNLVQQGGEN